MGENIVSEKKTPYISSMAGLKALCLVLLYWWHGPVTSPNVDLGARTCEFLFIASGFLVGYNAYYKTIPATWKESVRYVGRKLAAFWPLHLLAMLAVMFVLTDPILSWKNLIDAAINLLLLQSWSSKTHFSFNGASWFLSSLMFCYFLTPPFLRLSKKMRSSVIVFLAAFLVRLLIELIMVSYPKQYWTISLHSNPAVRALEFTMGTMMAAPFIKTRDSLHGKNLFWCMSLLELAALGGMIWLAIRTEGVWQRSFYLLPFCVLVFVYAFDGGLMSRLLASAPFKWLSSIQFEFFILHQAVIKCLADPLWYRFRNLWILNVLLIAIIIVLALVYKHLLSRKLSRLFAGAFNVLMAALSTDIRI